MSRFCTMVFLLYFALVTVCGAQIVHSYSFSHSHIPASSALYSSRRACSSENSLMVLSAQDIPQLLGHSIEQLSFFSLSSGQWRPRIFQIDQKDQQGRYILTPEDHHVVKIKNILSANDELVFRKGDLGERLDNSSEVLRLYSLLEIELAKDSGKPSGWIYINIAPIDLKSSTYGIPSLSRSLMSYDKIQDSVISPLYKIGFSSIVPFLIDSYSWRLPQQAGWSPDVSDMMKIRHKGKFWGLPFKRTQDDYHSRLVGVKKGPLRIIRRTENRIKVFWKLQTPALFIDYIMIPDGFVMDTMIDIPFKVDLFFSELETLTTMDWNNASGLPELTIHDAPFAKGRNLNLPVNGRQSLDKKAFNRIVNNEFSVSSNLGIFEVILDIPDNFPIQSNLYLSDDLTVADPPENYPGQFGNVGFRTTGWENINSELHHVKFTVCIKER